MQGAKKFSPVIFIFVLICFFLPFVNLSCGGQKISLTGIQLVIGVKVNQTQPKTAEQEKTTQDSLIIAAFIIAIAGFVLKETPAEMTRNE